MEANNKIISKGLKVVTLKKMPNGGKQEMQGWSRAGGGTGGHSPTTLRLLPVSMRNRAKGLARLDKTEAPIGICSVGSGSGSG